MMNHYSPTSIQKGSNLGLSRITPDRDVGDLKLQEAQQQFMVDQESDLPFWIWLIESPDSPLSLPGCIDLHGHDCIHLLLNRGISAYDEAFVLGFTMGNCESVRNWQITLMKVFLKYVYPRPYKLNKHHLQVFDLGFRFGQRLNYKNIHREYFDLYRTWSIQELREKYNICLEELQSIWRMEKILFQS